jgi:hypothetical protein
VLLTERILDVAKLNWLACYVSFLIMKYLAYCVIYIMQLFRVQYFSLYQSLHICDAGIIGDGLKMRHCSNTQWYGLPYDLYRNG